MNVNRWIWRRTIKVSLAAIGVAGIAPAAFAQGQYGQQIFSWTGRVDREVRINVQNNRVWTQDVGATEPGRARAQMISRMPRQDGQLLVQVENGRGNVDIIQQPSAQNGYTAVVRVRDNASGSDQYRIAGYWQSYSNGDVYGRNNNDINNNGRGVGRGRGRGRHGNGNDVYRDRDRDGRDDDAERRANDRGIYGQNSSQALHWSGNVDGELEIRIQNGRVEYRNISGQQPTSIRADRGNLNMPRTNATVTVSQNQGRGSVFVAQQPSSWNGYTTVIRVRDPQGGYGFYDFSLMWQ